MRNRFTAVDLLAIAGRWEKADWERVLELTALTVDQVMV
jgi:hypothetical protein